jgi:AraC family transcriptional regulator
MKALARAAVAELAGTGSTSATAGDARITRALAHIRSRVRAPVSLADAAAAATLSPSRFRHLFVQETGTSFRAYLLWLRINVAIEAAMAGASWTEAAHEAGFADSSHLTRTHKRMFGIEPTAIRHD